MTAVNRWWCRMHGLSIFYHLEKGSDVKRCGQPHDTPDGRTLYCGYPVRLDTKMDHYAAVLGDHALDHWLYSTAVHAAQGGPHG